VSKSGNESLFLSGRYIYKINPPKNSLSRRGRYGPHGNPVERGEVVPGSFCSRDFEACHRRRCKIQSPNYPGLFPRNVTCHFTVRHRDKQPCKHILVQVGQLKSHKVQLKTPPVGSRHGMIGASNYPDGSGQPCRGKSCGGIGTIPSSSASSSQQSILFQEDALVSWEDCAQGNRDSLTFYDGNSVMDPVLLVVCGGGHVPPVTSSSSEILVVFRATPYGNPMDSKPSPPYPEPLRGFELDVDIITVDSETADYSNFKNNCTFVVSTFTTSKSSDLKNPLKLFAFFVVSSESLFSVLFLYYSLLVNRETLVLCINLKNTEEIGSQGRWEKSPIQDTRFLLTQLVDMNSKGRSMRLFGFTLSLTAGNLLW